MVNGQKLENKIVHLSAIHGITFGNSTNLSPTRKPYFFIAKRNSSSYNIAFQSNWEKASIPSKFSTFIQKGEMGGLPKVNFGLPNSSPPKILFSLNIFTKHYKLQNDQPFTRRVPLGCLETSSTSKLQRRCLQRHKDSGTEC